ncbi:MAG: PAS domain S-box protein, partial [Chitinophagaceae bacterium]|nr:PAS domain S-box protein [Chitinophagaceae bacterium]
MITSSKPKLFYFKLIVLAFSILLLFFSFLFILRINEQEASVAKLEHFNLVQFHLAETINCLIKTESSQQAYLITDDTAFITQRSKTIKEARAHLNQLDSLGAKHPREKTFIHTLKMLIEKRTDSLEKALNLYQTTKALDEELKQTVSREITFLSSIQAYAARISSEEAILIEKYKPDAENNSIPIKYVWLLVILSPAALLLSALSVVNELRFTKIFFRQRAAETLLRNQLQQRTSLAEAAVENSANIVMGLDTHLNYTMWNKAGEKLACISKKELLGKNMTEVFRLTNHKEGSELIKRGLKGETIYGVELPYKNGERTGEFTFLPLKDINENVTNLVVICNDVTERIRTATDLKRLNESLLHTNEALKTSESFNRSITELAPNAIYIYDLTTYDLVFVNSVLIKFLGLKSSEIKKGSRETVRSLIHPDDLPRLSAHYKMFREGAKTDVLELEYRVRNENGEYRHIFIRETVFKRNEKGEPSQVLGIGVDLTQLKAAEEEHLQLNKILEEKNKELEQSNKELASFNHIASHDLQEPLRKIQTFSNYLLKDETLISAHGKLFLHRMHVAVSGMRNLIKDLLTFSETSVLQEEFDSVDLNAILREVKSSLKTIIEEKEAIIISTRLPSIKGLSYQLQQLFTNLLGNALKYNTPGITPEISITSKLITAGDISGLQPGHQYWLVSFKDNGLGFEQEYADKIFELFQRLHSKTDYPGTGIGLAICKKIVENHGGHI